MSEQNSNICPCCRRGCDLSAPQCHRGEEYLRTGVIPEKKSHAQHEHHHGPRLSEDMTRTEKITLLLSMLGKHHHHGPHGKGGQKRILHLLSKTGGMTQRELTEQLGIQPGSASEIIKKLETTDLISRSTNENDRRIVDIQLTEAGKAEAEKIEQLRKTESDDLYSVLTDEEQDQLLAILQKLAETWHTHEKHDHEHHEHHEE